MVTQAQRRTKAQLLEEMEELRKQLAAGETTATTRRRAEESLRKSQTELELQLQERVLELEKQNEQLRSAAARPASAQTSASDMGRAHRLRLLAILLCILSLLLLALVLYLYFGQVKPLEHQLATARSQVEAGASQLRDLEKKSSDLVEKIRLEFVDRIMFSSGSTRISLQGKKILTSLGNRLKATKDKVIRLEGHADAVPIRAKSRRFFPSNWELSASRAGSIARFLESTVHIAPARMAVVGMGDTHPLADDRTPDGRARNRRVEIFFAPEQGR